MAQWMIQSKIFIHAASQHRFSSSKKMTTVWYLQQHSETYSIAFTPAKNMHPIQTTLSYVIRRFWTLLRKLSWGKIRVTVSTSLNLIVNHSATAVAVLMYAHPTKSGWRLCKQATLYSIILITSPSAGTTSWPSQDEPAAPGSCDSRPIVLSHKVGAHCVWEMFPAGQRAFLCNTFATWK